MSSIHITCLPADVQLAKSTPDSGITPSRRGEHDPKHDDSPGLVFSLCKGRLDAVFDSELDGGSVKAMILRPALCLLMTVSALVAQAQPPAAVEGESLSACEYLGFFASPESNEMGREPASGKQVRRDALERASRKLIELGLHRVEAPSASSWTLKTGTWVAKNGSLMIRLALLPGAKTEHHMFVVLMGDPTYPFRGDLGGGRLLEILESESSDSINARVDRNVQMIWNREAEQILALCAAREKLVKEGWAEIEELRLKMIAEMEAIRRRRAEITQRKQLDIEVEHLQHTDGKASPATQP